MSGEQASVIEGTGLTDLRRLNDATRGDGLFVGRRPDGVEVVVRRFGRLMRAGRDHDQFRHESDRLRSLASTPYVLPVSEAGIGPDGHAFLITPFCPAGSLRDRVATVGRYTPSEVAQIGAKLASALAELHRHAVVHRNVTPANVMLTDRREPALTDFVLVSVATAAGDFTPPVVGKNRPYQAPGAYLPELMGPADDVFSLGATLYALVAGWAPYVADPLAPALDGDTVADLPRVPWSLMSVIKRAMAHDPRDRFADACQMSDALMDAA